jgi:predicted dehydrogenase
MASYGFGIIGCGMVSEFASAAISEISDARLVAVASRTESNRRKLMDKYGCEGVEDYHDLVARDDVDIVCVCTPSGAHMEPAVAAAGAGKHVVIEKPIEIALDRVDGIIQACDKAGVGLCSMLPARFTVAAQTLKQAVSAGRFGRLTVADCYNKWWRDQAYYDSGAWRGTRALDGGGACMNQGIHAVDLIQWFMGPVESVFGQAACLAHTNIEVEDTAVATVRYANGALGVIECATSAWPGVERRIEIHGDEGSAVMSDDYFTRWEFKKTLPEDEDIRRRFAVPTGKGGGAADARSIAHVNHREQLKDFIRSLESGTKPLVDGREGRKAVEIILAIYESSRNGRPVRLPLHD